MTTQSLSQAELDDAYHQAIFDCDQAVSDRLVDYFADKPELKDWRNDLINVLLEAIGKCEVNHLGDRYDAMIARLMARGEPARPMA